MTGADRTMISCAADLDEIAEDVRDQLDDSTDLSVELWVDETYASVQQGPGSFALDYPFALEDLLSWTYHFENDYTVRHEIQDDVEKLLERTPTDGRDDAAIVEFVHELLLTDWIATDGSELMIMDGDGRPLELTARFTWETPTAGDVERPFRPDPSLTTKAQLFPDGRLVMPQTADQPALELDIGAVGSDEALRAYATR